MPKKLTKRKKEIIKEKRRRFLIDLLLSTLVIIVPIIALFLYAFGVDIPIIVFGIYASAAFIVAGILFITFTALEKFGFGKAGVGFNRFTGFKQMTKEEVKANTGVFGGVMIAIGIFFVVLTIIYC